jgi:lysozyme family protein
VRYAAKWPQYAQQWDRMQIKPGRLHEFEQDAQYAINHKPTYIEISRKTGVPWELIAVLHRRESDADFSKYLGNGEPLNRKTRLVPKGRGPFASFSDGAVDALHIDGLDAVIDWRLEKMLYHCELFNGTGYDAHGRPSPYVWGGTNIQVRGKYASDHKWDPSLWDPQPGCAPLLATIAKLDSSVQFVRES